MARYKLQGRAVDSYGNIQPSIGITIYLTGTTTPAKIYTTDVSTPAIEIAPQIITDSYGRFGFWVDTNDYPIVQTFDIYADGLSYTEVDIFRGFKVHGDMLNLLQNDHPQYANLTQSERISGTWIFNEDTKFEGTIDVVGNITGNRIFTNTITPTGSYELVSKGFLDTLSERLSGASIEDLNRLEEYTDTMLLSTSASSDEADQRLREYVNTFVFDTSAATIAYVDLQNELQTASLSASVDENINRLTEYVDTENNTQTASLSASSIEGDNRLYEYIDLENSTQTFQLSASVDENINRLTEYTNTMLHSTSAASLEADRTLREYTNVMLLSTSASSKESDQRLYERITSVSGSSLESDNRIYEYIDLENNIQTQKLSAASLESDNRLSEDIGNLTGQVRSFEASAGDSLRDLQGRMTTHEISAKGLFDEERGRLTSLEASASERFYKIETVFTDMDEPTGFLNRTDSVITFTDSTSAFSISGTGGSFDYYIKGVKYTVSGIHTLPIIASGPNFYYFDTNETLNVISSFNTEILLASNAYVATVYWNDNDNKNVYMGDERHGITMDWVTHAYLHTTEGTRYVDGLSLTDITVDSTGGDDSYATFTVTSGDIRDEDLLHTISEVTSASTFPILYREGANGRWNIDESTIFPVLSFSAGSNLLAYNNFTGGSWTQTEVADGEYVLAHIFAINDPNRQVVAIQGQNTYSTVTAARTAATTEILSLSIGEMPFAEFLPIATVIYQTSTSYGNSVQARIVSTDEGDNYIDFRTFKGGSTGGTNVDDHGNLSGLSDDDHLQYTRADGTRAFTGTVAGITPTLDTHLTTKLYVDTENDTQTNSLSASVDENINRLTEYVDDNVSTINTTTDSLSASSREQDNRIREYASTITGVASAATIQYVDSENDLQTISLSAASLEGDRTLYDYINALDSLPSGGIINDILVKQSGVDGDADWTYRINDRGLTSTDLWSANKITTLLASGSTVWHEDEGVPLDTLGAMDDYYLDTLTGNIYKKDIIDWSTDLVDGSGTATAISILTGHDPEDAFDGSTSTYWMQDPYSLPAWLKYDTGAGNEITPQRLGLYVSDQRYTRNFRLEGSNNDIDYDLLVDDNHEFGGWKYYDFTDNTTAYRYFVLWVDTTATSSFKARIDELELYSNTGYIWRLIWDNETFTNSLSAASVEGDRRQQEYTDTQITSISAASREQDNRIYEYLDNFTSLPSGGTTGQVLSKVDNTDWNVEWADSTGGSGEQSLITTTHTASAGQTSFVHTADITNELVFLNGVNLITTTDYTVSGSVLTLAEPTIDNDVCEIISIGNFEVANAVAKTGDTMSGALTLSGDPTNDLHATTKLYVDTENDAQTASLYPTYSPSGYTLDTNESRPIDQHLKGIDKEIVDRERTLSMGVSAINWNWNTQSETASVTLSADATLLMISDFGNSLSGLLRVIQDSTGGWTLSFDTGYDYGATAVDILTDADGETILGFYAISSTDVRYWEVWRSA